jgi:hypothetical protein
VTRVSISGTRCYRSQAKMADQYEAGGSIGGQMVPLYGHLVASIEVVVSDANSEIVIASTEKGYDDFLEREREHG